ncbi:hypothetical protein DL98DRAFT_522520 [Cadophora sp. DSE1049]|nr:hypothetical protein DL98DRAFT_522520 [Cadophora sp. DSE1049]
MKLEISVVCFLTTASQTPRDTSKIFLIIINDASPRQRLIVCIILLISRGRMWIVESGVENPQSGAASDRTAIWVKLGQRQNGAGRNWVLTHQYASTSNSMP